MTQKKIVIGVADALVMIDAENDFGHPNGALYAKGFPYEASNDEVKRNILYLLTRPFGFHAKTRDEHPDSGHIEFGLYGRHVVKGTWGAEYLAELQSPLSLVDFELIKGEDPALISLSIMVSPMFGEFIAKLRALGITRVFVCGWAYTHCVGLSAIAIANQGFDVSVVRDATRSVSADFGGDPVRMAQQLAFDGVKEIMIADLM